MCLLYTHRFLGDGVLGIPDYETLKPRKKVYDIPLSKRYRLSIRVGIDLYLTVVGASEVPVTLTQANCHQTI